MIVYSGTTCDSTELVPGDIVNLSTSQLSIVPADLFLLSGDAIINESMLTGESVPVSKAAAKDEDILKWKDEKSENPKTFLYGGTRVIRIRGIMSGVGQERPALGLVARTGKLICSEFFRSMTCYFRFRHDERRTGSLHVVSKTNWVQVLPRLS
jgi:magnesium-transporting ATPase (P-type)